MNKNEFLSILRKELTSLTAEEVDDILYDYEEHFNIGIEKGKGEEEIASSLGDPKKIARSYKTISVIDDVNKNPTPSNIFKAVLATISLGFFNLIFVLGPFLGLVGALIGFFAAAIGVILGGLAAVASPFLNIIFPDLIYMGIQPIAAILVGLGTIAIGILILLFAIYISKLLAKGTVKYLNWNVQIIQRGMVKNG